jgi:hypothetical protein
LRGASYLGSEHRKKKTLQGLNPQDVNSTSLLSTIALARNAPKPRNLNRKPPPQSKPNVNSLDTTPMASVVTALLSTQANEDNEGCLLLRFLCFLL